MAIKFNSVKCPECGADLPIEENREQLFCSYCGAHIVVTNENEYIYHHIDEAGIKKAEVDKEVQLKKLEIIEKKCAEAAKNTKIKIIISIIMGIIGIVLLLTNAGIGGMVGWFILIGVMFIWVFSNKNEEEDVDFGDKVKVPSTISNYEQMNYASVESILSSAGFTNIDCVALNDLTTGLLKKPSMVESITINGHKIESGGKKFAGDAKVIISYHSFAGR